MNNQQLCPICNGEMWDNRSKKFSPKAPDFKCKDASCKGVIWPPRNGAIPVNQIPPVEPQEQREPVNQEETGSVWDAKDRQNMYQSALKAASEIVSAYLARPDAEINLTDAEAKVTTMAQDFYWKLVSHRSGKEDLPF